MPVSRSIQRVYPSLRATEGAGFQVHRPFPTRLLADFDPFLLLDEMGPVEYAPGTARGAPDHPHRGFETVTYILEGHFRHRDSAGHSGELRAGDVQWMTAGSGLIHSEMPDPEFAAAGGRAHGFQLWVNLRRADKKLAPRYQEIASADIPRVLSEDGRGSIRVIAGEAFGARSRSRRRRRSSTCICPCSPRRGSPCRYRASSACSPTRSPAPATMARAGRSAARSR